MAAGVDAIIGARPLAPGERSVHRESPREPKLKTMRKVPCFKSEGLPAAKAAEMEASSPDSGWD